MPKKILNFLLLLSLLYCLSLSKSILVSAQTPIPTPTIPPVTGYTVSRSCSADSSEPHPLRPYPAEICGPVQAPDLPFCAMRPWAVAEIEYLKNIQDCPLDHPMFPCIQKFVSGDYRIDLSEYELPLVSVNRPGFNDLLTFFNRAQEHLADYLEGRSYYEGIAEPSLVYGDPDDPYTLASRLSASYQIWNRLGVLRKLMPLSLQDQLKRQNLRNAQSPDQSIHNYIVAYQSAGEPADWRTGSPVRMTGFIGHEPPMYNCAGITNRIAFQQCLENFRQQQQNWLNSIQGKLWAYVPMVSREDTVGYVSMFPEPGQPFTIQTNEVSIPHLNRLNTVTNILQGMLSSYFLKDPYFNPYPTVAETEPYEGFLCPAGPWNFCPAGPGMEPGDYQKCADTENINCNQSATATDACVKSQFIISDLAYRWVSGVAGNHVDQCYHDVIGRARARGINPALTMLIWLNESNASNYNITAYDFGVMDNSATCNFTGQISRFLNLPGYYRSNWSSCFSNPPTITDLQGNTRPMTAIEVFLAIFQSGDCDIASGQSYALGLLNRWDWVSNCAVPTRPEI